MTDISGVPKFKNYYMLVMSIFYGGQGFSLGSLTLLLPLYINNDLNVGSYAAAVIISTIIITPWFIKFFFGLLTDNYPIGRFGRRKPYLIIATIFSAIGWLTLGLHREANFLFILSGFMLALGSAIADTTIDGQVVEITPQKYAGRMQGIAWGSRGLGIGLAGIISANLVFLYDWQTMFNVSAIFGIGISIVVLILPQAPYSSYIKGLKLRHVLKSIRAVTIDDQNYDTAKRSQFFLLTGISISIVPMLAIIMQKEFGYDFDQIGIGAFSFAIGALIGSIISGYFFDRRDNLRNFSILTILSVMTILISLFYINPRTEVLQYVFFVIVGLTSGGYEAYQLKVIQESTVKDQEGTLFSLAAAISNIGQFVVSGWLLVLISEFFDLNLLITLLLLIPALLIAIIPINHFKFRKS